MTEVIFERLPVSMFLGFQAVLIGVVTGLVLGVISGLKQNTLLDSAAAFIAVLGVSIPDLVLAPLLQYWLGLKLGSSP